MSRTSPCLRSSALPCVLVLFLTMAPPPAAAAGKDEAEQARVHLRKATAAYNLGHFADAAREYEAAYENTLDASTLFNVGEAWRQAGEPQRALTAYRSYLRTVPKGQQRELAETRIRELEEPSVSPPSSGAPASFPEPPTPVATPVAAPPAATPASPWSGAAVPVPLETRAMVASQPGAAPAVVEPSPFYRRWPFWTVLGGVVVAGVVAAVVLSSGGSHDVSMPPTTYGTKAF